MNRIDRISAILIHLQSGRKVRAKDIADRFGISLRTVYRDVQTLLEAGVPVIGEAGHGYCLAEGYRLPPVQFVAEEATALLTAGKLVEHLTDKATFVAFESAMYKIRAVLRTSEKDQLDYLSPRITVLPSIHRPVSEEKYLPVILQSLTDRMCLDMDYEALSSGEDSKRTIEAAGIFFMSGHWYTVAYCHLRKDYRHFRCDRIRALRPIMQPFSLEHPPVQGWVERVSRTEKNLVKVVIEMETPYVRYLGDQKYYSGFVEELPGEEGHTRLVFLTSSIPGFARWMMMFTGHMNVLEPVSLLDEMKAISRNFLAQP